MAVARSRRNGNKAPPLKPDSAVDLTDAKLVGTKVQYYHHKNRNDLYNGCRFMIEKELKRSELQSLTGKTEGQEVTWSVRCLEEGEMAKDAPTWINSSCCYAVIVDGPAVVATEAGGNADEDNEEATQPNVDEANANENNEEATQPNDGEMTEPNGDGGEANGDETNANENNEEAAQTNHDETGADDEEMTGSNGDGANANENNEEATQPNVDEANANEGDGGDANGDETNANENNEEAAQTNHDGTGAGDEEMAESNSDETNANENNGEAAQTNHDETGADDGETNAGGDTEGPAKAAATATYGTAEQLGCPIGGSKAKGVVPMAPPGLAVGEAVVVYYQFTDPPIAGLGRNAYFMTHVQYDEGMNCSMRGSEWRLTETVLKSQTIVDLDANLKCGGEGDKPSNVAAFCGVLAFPGAHHGKPTNYAVLKMVVGAPEGSVTFAGGLVIYPFSGLRELRVQPGDMPGEAREYLKGEIKRDPIILPQLTCGGNVERLTAGVVAAMPQVGVAALGKREAPRRRPSAEDQLREAGAAKKGSSGAAKKGSSKKAKSNAENAKTNLGPKKTKGVAAPGKTGVSTAGETQREEKQREEKQRKRERLRYLRDEEKKKEQRRAAAAGSRQGIALPALSSRDEVEAVHASAMKIMAETFVESELKRAEAMHQREMDKEAAALCRAKQEAQERKDEQQKEDAADAAVFRYMQQQHQQPPPQYQQQPQYQQLPPQYQRWF